jgi:NADH-quinone oxidoreductase subunit J
MVYVGGILVLLLFGIMLTHRIYGLDLRTGTYQVIPGLIAYVVLGGVLLFLLLRTGWRLDVGPEFEPTTGGLGKMLLTDYLLPFEIASVLLLAALIGAVMLVRGRPGEAKGAGAPGDGAAEETGGAAP